MNLSALPFVFGVVSVRHLLDAYKSGMDQHRRSRRYSLNIPRLGQFHSSVVVGPIAQAGFS
jgi:hypothetical protein